VHAGSLPNCEHGVNESSYLVEAARLSVEIYVCGGRIDQSCCLQHGERRCPSLKEVIP
jgi:hypothetical protein